MIFFQLEGGVGERGVVLVVRCHESRLENYTGLSWVILLVSSKKFYQSHVENISGLAYEILSISRLGNGGFLLGKLKGLVQGAFLVSSREFYWPRLSNITGSV